MELDPVERARRRLASLRGDGPSREAIEATLARAQQALSQLAEQATVLETSVPEQVSRGIHEAIEREVLPVARNLAEVRGLSSQILGRIDRVHETVDAERQARIDDLDVLVDLIAASWESVDARLARIEHSLAALATAQNGASAPIETPAVASSQAGSLLRFEERRPSAS